METLGTSDRRNERYNVLAGPGRARPGQAGPGRHLAGRRKSNAHSLQKGRVNKVEISKPSSLNEMSGNWPGRTGTPALGEPCEKQCRFAAKGAG